MHRKMCLCQGGKSETSVLPKYEGSTKGVRGSTRKYEELQGSMRKYQGSNKEVRGEYKGVRGSTRKYEGVQGSMREYEEV
jgi:hypothetical protein